MVIYLDDFIKKYKGKFLDADGSYGAQCVDVVRGYVKEVLATTYKPVGSLYAYDLFKRGLMPKLFKKVANDPKNPNQLPPRGSVFVLSGKTPGSGGAGHTGIVLSSTKTKMTVLEQNAPVGSPCRVANRGYGYLLGWLVPNKPFDPKPAPVMPVKPTVSLKAPFTSELAPAEHQSATSPIKIAEVAKQAERAFLELAPSVGPTTAPATDSDGSHATIELESKEGDVIMEETGTASSKVWYKSKTVWAGISAVVAGFGVFIQTGSWESLLLSLFGLIQIVLRFVTSTPLE
jgi:hypothetical protein